MHVHRHAVHVYKSSAVLDLLNKMKEILSCDLFFFFFLRKGRPSLLLEVYMAHY